jgi:colicin import membrane protein
VQRGYEGLSTELHVRVAPSGTVLDVQIVKKSGNEALDRSAVAAVHRASPLPVPTDPAVFESFREIRLILRPEDVLG